MSEDRILNVQDLVAYYKTKRGDVRAVDNVNLFLRPNEVLGIAGESGCGKTTLIKVLYGLVEPPLSVLSGQVLIDFNGEEIDLYKNTYEIRELWWKHFSYIPQSSMGILNPVIKIQEQFAEIFERDDTNLRKREIIKIVKENLDALGLPSEVLSSYPHQLSGGMRQRVVISMATIQNPKIVYADEPTTALDVVVQRGILEMTRKLQRKLGNTFVIVTHDMGVHYQVTDRMIIMYAGKISEIGRTDNIFKNPLHPYTALLIESLPRLGDKSQRKSIKGAPPSLLNPPKGCRFHPRCPYATSECVERDPPLVELDHERYLSCFNPLKD